WDPNVCLQRDARTPCEVQLLIRYFALAVNSIPTNPAKVRTTAIGGGWLRKGESYVSARRASSFSSPDRPWSAIFSPTSLSLIPGLSNVGFCVECGESVQLAYPACCRVRSTSYKVPSTRNEAISVRR